MKWQISLLKLFLNLLFRQANLTTAVSVLSCCLSIFLGLGLLNCPSAHIFVINHSTASSSAVDGKTFIWKRGFDLPPSVVDKEAGSLPLVPAFPQPGWAGVSQGRQKQMEIEKVPVRIQRARPSAHVVCSHSRAVLWRRGSEYRHRCTHAHGHSRTRCADARCTPNTHMYKHATPQPRHVAVYVPVRS